MRTLDEVRDSCVILPPDDSDDGREHWVFRGTRIHAPDFTADPAGQTLVTQRPRRAARHIATGRPIPKGWRVWSRCRVEDCVNPACLACGNLQAYGRARARSGADKGQLPRILANRRNSDKQRKITRAMADDILGSNASNIALAARLGLHRETVSRVRRGLTRVPGNIFQGLAP
jgi:hypothetical protein